MVLRRHFCPVVTLLMTMALPLMAADPLPADYAVTWTTPGKEAVDSMPLAGGILGCNVWVQGDDVLLLLASPNCLDEKGMQVKAGRLRVHLGEGVLGRDLRQTLDPSTGRITVSGRTAAGKAVTALLWCDTSHPILRIEVRAEEPVALRAAYETWSTYQPTAIANGVQWVRRLPEVNPRRLADLKAQGMVEFAALVPDPLSRLTVGGRMEVSVPVTSVEGKDPKVRAITTAPVTAADLTVTLRMEQDPSLEAWTAGLEQDARRAREGAAADRAAAVAWWQAYWNRSYIVIAPQAGVARDHDRPWLAARNYQLSRYQLAANTGGRAPTLFNGGLFVCTGDPDRRFWDSCQFMAQNQRLIYWPLLRSGDLDQLTVALDFYRDRTAMSKAHAKKFFGVEGGVAWSEPFSIFGLDALGTNAEGRSKPGHLNYHYTSGMEFALMMLEYERYGGVPRPGYHDPALGILAYYDQYYQAQWTKKTGKPLDAEGSLVIYPSDACEPYHGCTNNTDVVAGLMALSRELMALPAQSLTAEQRAYVTDFQRRIPALPIVEKDGRKYYAAAKSWERVMKNGNMDFPQMYVLFPFSIDALGRSDLSLAKNTWDLSPIEPAVQHQNQCWYQTAIQFARLGMTHEAADATLDKLLHPGLRFPAFYLTHYADGQKPFCHPPDTDHIGTSLLSLQEMLLQTDGRRILVGPAWPREWNVRFKLNAPFKTTVEGHVEGGQVIIDQVTPAARRADVEILPLKSASGA